ncbi:MAG: asparagine synthase (glutamine-hydrolyzing) [Chloroflexi bacterium]|nr:MAG: asparagine synthase (glutamine-hydrolyzing) [Chloroflexota bacterium]
MNVMCGIAGIVGTQDQTLVMRMMDSLRHRGPDGIGYCWRSNVHLGAARLSIIDPDAGLQPLYNETGELCIVFNGEIYNHHKLRTDLKRKGHIFTTETDTEVVLHLYEEMGDDCVHHLHGMFAFAILDGERLFLARDRYGIKPLYYTFLPEKQLFLFASEIKGILQCPEYTPRLDMQTLADWIALNHPVGTETFFEGVRSLATGSTMSIRWDQQITISEPRSYFTPHFIRDKDISLAEALEVLEAVLRNSVEAHLAADVDIGFTLSGGLDSTLLALLGHEYQSRPIFTFSVADGEHHPDLLQAQSVAHMIGSSHQSVVISFDEYLAAIPGCATAEEQPISLSGLPAYFLCGKIAHQVKACLLGEGADELFGGYREYLDREFKLSRIRMRTPLLKQLGVSPSDRALNLIERLSSSPPFDQYLQSTFEMNLSDPLERHHLNIFDKYGMAAGVEMRVPYLDDSLLELVNQFPLRHLVRRDLGITKYILRHLCLRRFGYDVTDVVLRRKESFPSVGMRLEQRFDRLCDEILPDDYLTQHELGFCFKRKRSLLLFELFYEIFMVHRGDGKTVGSILSFLKSR